MIRFRTALLLILVPVLACAADEGSGDDAAGVESGGDDDDDDDDDDVDPNDLPDSAACDASGDPIPVSLMTEDGLALEADFHGAGVVGGPAVILLHMIPPGNDKSNYPPEFIGALVDAGYSVLNVNRRGAGNSEGAAEDAYEGPSGVLDAIAAHGFVTTDGCQAPANAVSIVGASNGTTTTIDFTVSAEAGDRPPSLVLLSPGGYTENQNAIADNVDVLAPLPIFIGYPDDEATWPEANAVHDTGAWEQHEYEGGSHGSGLFRSHPDIVGEIVAFIEATNPS